MELPRMMTGSAAPTSATTSANVPPLPAIILRNAKIDYSEIRAGEPVMVGSMTIEGQLRRAATGIDTASNCKAAAAIRNGSATLGPTVSGMLVRNTGLITAELRDFQFGQDIRSMLPAKCAHGGIGMS